MRKHTYLPHVNFQLFDRYNFCYIFCRIFSPPYTELGFNTVTVCCLYLQSRFAIYFFTNTVSPYTNYVLLYILVISCNYSYHHLKYC